VDKDVKIKKIETSTVTSCGGAIENKTYGRHEKVLFRKVLKTKEI